MSADEADVLVFGSGAAGLSAAVTAAELGASVVLYEKSGSLGGTTAKSGGVYWIPGNHLMRERGIPDDLAQVVRYAARVSAGDAYDADDPYLGLDPHDHALHEAYIHAAAPAIKWLEACGALRSTIETALQFPDYHMNLAEQGGVYGRALCPMDAAGRPGNGAELIDQLTAHALAHGVRIRTEHAFRDMVVRDGRVVGAVVATDGATDFEATARLGVVLATGGFTHHASLRRTHMPTRVWGGCAVATNTGDVLAPLARHGVPMDHLDCAWWDQVAIEHTLAGTTETRAGMWVAPGDASLIVDLSGRRVGNEKQFYSDRARRHLDPGHPEIVVLVYDERTATLFCDLPFAYPLPQPGESNAHVISGDTWAELIGRIDARLATLAGPVNGARLSADFVGNLARTVHRYGELARAGVDVDHRRGEQPIEAFFSGVRRPGGGPSPVMAPLAESGPYYAVLLGLGTLDTKGGPRTGTHGEVLSADGLAVPGLYAAGNCAASCSGQGYWAAGATIGPALVFGHLAARHLLAAADEPALREAQLAEGGGTRWPL